MNKIIFILTLSAFLFSQQAEVTNIQAAQRTDGSQIVDITYDITPDAVFTYFEVSGHVSMDGGGSYEDMQFAAGDIGIGITAGTGRAITWGFGQQFNETYSNQVKIKINATSTAIIAGDSLEVPFEMITIPAGDYTYGENDAVQSIAYDYNMMKYDVTDYDYVVYLLDQLGDGNNTEECLDLVNPDGTPWSDGYQSAPWGCSEYETNNYYGYDNCGAFGDFCFDTDTDTYGDADELSCMGANEACCFCGGGSAAPAIYINQYGIHGSYPGDAQYPAGTYQFLDFSQSKISYNGEIFEVEEGYVDHPVTGVTWFGAWHFAVSYGLQLPNEFEWEKAARGLTGNDYPWGDEIIDYNCNFGNIYGGTTPVDYFTETNEPTNDPICIDFNFQTDYYFDESYYSLCGIIHGCVVDSDHIFQNSDEEISVTHCFLPDNWTLTLGDDYGDGGITVNYWHMGQEYEYSCDGLETNVNIMIDFISDGSTDSPSPYGLYDMAGNVSQWLNKSPTSSTSGIKGGNWQDPPENLVSWNILQQDPITSSNKMGFRCIKPISVNLNRNPREMLEEHERRHRQPPVHPNDRNIDGP